MTTADVRIIGDVEDLAATVARVVALVLDASVNQHVKSGGLSVEFGGDGLKNRRLRQCKILISEVLILVTLSVCAEVAEWPKAAVC